MIDTATLQRLGLRAGEPVRFRKGDAGRWYSGKMSGVAIDGSITIFDANGGAEPASGTGGGAPARAAAAGSHGRPSATSPSPGSSCSSGDRPATGPRPRQGSVQHDVEQAEHRLLHGAAAAGVGA